MPGAFCIQCGDFVIDEELLVLCFFEQKLFSRKFRSTPRVTSLRSRLPAWCFLQQFEFSTLHGPYVAENVFGKYCASWGCWQHRRTHFLDDFIVITKAKWFAPLSRCRLQCGMGEVWLTTSSPFPILHSPKSQVPVQVTSLSDNQHQHRPEMITTTATTTVTTMMAMMMMKKMKTSTQWWRWREWKVFSFVWFAPFP